MTAFRTIPASIDDRLLSEAEAIEALGLAGRRNPKSALRWLIRTKRLGVVKVGQGVLAFKRSDVAAFIERAYIAAD